MLIFQGLSVICLLLTTPAMYIASDRVSHSGLAINPRVKSLPLTGQRNKKLAIMMILGGQQATPKPWLALLRTGYPSLSGGGVLISKNMILTAAHLTPKEAAIIPHAATMRYKIDSNTYGEKGIDFKVLEIIPHPDFKPYPNLQNDLAIWIVVPIKNYANTLLEFPLMPWNLKSESLNPTSEVFGWGRTSTDQSASSNKYLQSISIPMCPPSERDMQDLSLIREKIVATSGANGPMQGDSGSPLIATTPKGVPVLQGIVSCRTERTPVYHYYTKISEYEDWIKSVGDQVPNILGKSLVDRLPFQV